MAILDQKLRYSPPWGDASIIGVAGSSGSGKTSLALAIVASLNLPWVVIMSMVSIRCSERLRYLARALMLTGSGLFLQASYTRAV
jgi:ABC-type dipeptide/oligopeptide/nickel transport system ATPase component